MFKYSSGIELKSVKVSNKKVRLGSVAVLKSYRFGLDLFFLIWETDNTVNYLLIETW